MNRHADIAARSLTVHVIHLYTNKLHANYAAECVFNNEVVFATPAFFQMEIFITKPSITHNILRAAQDGNVILNWMCQ